MLPDPKEQELDSLRREVVALRVRVAELQRAAARREEHADASLAEREELLAAAERTGHFGTWTWDIASGRVTWSYEMFRILGLERGSTRPSVEGFFELVHESLNDTRYTSRPSPTKSSVFGIVMGRRSISLSAMS